MKMKTCWISSHLCHLRMSEAMTLFVVCLLQIINPTTQTTAADERTANAVAIALYQVSESDWTSSVKTKFQDTVISEANSYCKANLGSCDLTNMPSEFTALLIEYPSAAKWSKPNLDLTYVLALPNDSVKVTGGNAHYLKKSALEAISVNTRSSLKSSAKVDISEVGTTDYGPVPDAVVNGVVSAVMALIVIALGITICALNAKCSDDYVYISEHIKPDRQKDIEKDEAEVTPEPITPKSVAAVDEGKLTEENQNGAPTPVVTVMSQSGPEVSQVTS